MTRRSFLSLAGSACGLGLLALAGCSSGAQPAPEPDAAPEPATTPDSAPAPDPAPAEQPAADSPAAGGGKVLVAYYSATGSTRAVAEDIAADLGADLFEITPAEPYGADDLNWRDEGSRVSREHDDPSLRDVALVQTVPDGFAGYDTVFVGYPIWWGGAAWPVDGFVETNDFSGKTVIPFCTSSSSGLGSSAADLAAVARGGNWLPGQRFSSGVAREDVTRWVGTLDLGA
ncbi:MAG: flavodoxin [Eggerthellaceae bacterium]|nr:flavodoxin [Eggerthellaceae bacterium]